MTSKSTDAVTVKKVEIDSDDSFNKMIGLKKMGLVFTAGFK